MVDVIIIGGAPGVGKSTVSRLVHRSLGTPMFEFCWIPEFRNRPNGDISYDEEETISLENLILVTKNYIRHGFTNVILTDLRERRLPEMEKRLAGYAYRIFTLVITDEQILKKRVLDPGRSSGYRDWVASIGINSRNLTRPLLPKEIKLDVTNIVAPEVAARIVGQV